MTILSHFKCILQVKLLHWEHISRHMKSWAVVHECRELRCVECGGHQDYLKVRSFVHYLLENNKEDVSEDVSLVDLIKDDVGEGLALGV